MQIPTYFPRQHRPANTTVEYWARPQDWPGVVWHDYPASGPKAPPMQGAGGYGKGRRPLVSGLLPSNSCGGIFWRRCLVPRAGRAVLRAAGRSR